MEDDSFNSNSLQNHLLTSTITTNACSNSQNDLSKPNIVKMSKNATVLIGAMVSLQVNYTPNKMAQVKWFRKNQELFSSNNIQIHNEDGLSTLIIYKIMHEDSGKYSVEITNEFGSDKKFTFITVKEPPEPPAGKPSLFITNDTSITIFWSGTTYDGGSAVIGYAIEMQQNNSDWKIISNLCKNNTFVTNNLTTNHHYAFRVRAINDIGVSQPSIPSDTIQLVQLNCENQLNDLESVKVRTIMALTDLYEVKEEVGRGRFGICKRVIEISSSKEKAAKFIRCLRLKDKEEVYQEIKVMNRLRHPRLLQLEDALEVSKEIVLITEFISGGELFERIVADDYVLTELECTLFMRQICDGVKYMHDKNVIHLDLKPENVLCRTRSSYEIKIIDFGLARIYDPKEPLKVLFGTPEFVAPEVIQYEPICPKADMWSIGVICYVLLSGLSPFLGNTDQETFTNVIQCDYDFEDEVFDNISEKAKNFISSLLVKRPEKRMSAEQCLAHPWLELKGESLSNVQLPKEKLKKFLVRRKWLKTTTAILALGRMTNKNKSNEK